MNQRTLCFALLQSTLPPPHPASSAGSLVWQGYPQNQPPKTHSTYSSYIQSIDTVCSTRPKSPSHLSGTYSNNTHVSCQLRYSRKNQTCNSSGWRIHWNGSLKCWDFPNCKHTRTLHSLHNSVQSCCQWKIKLTAVGFICYNDKWKFSQFYLINNNSLDVVLVRWCWQASACKNLAKDLTDKEETRHNDFIIIIIIIHPKKNK